MRLFVSLPWSWGSPSGGSMGAPFAESAMRGGLSQTRDSIWIRTELEGRLDDDQILTESNDGHEVARHL